MPVVPIYKCGRTCPITNCMARARASIDTRAPDNIAMGASTAASCGDRRSVANFIGAAAIMLPARLTPFQMIEIRNFDFSFTGRRRLDSARSLAGI
jgi:hypothetical protein